MVVPYKIAEETDEYQIRVFEDFNSEELFWHRDTEDRIVELLEGCVEFQFDNTTPFEMKPSQIIYINALEYHRVIAKERFVIKVYIIK